MYGCIKSLAPLQGKYKKDFYSKEGSIPLLSIYSTAQYL